eukprot:11216925-Heterocapsa_arctica.AAC.1
MQADWVNKMRAAVDEATACVGYTWVVYTLTKKAPTSMQHAACSMQHSDSGSTQQCDVRRMG